MSMVHQDEHRLYIYIANFYEQREYLAVIQSRINFVSFNFKVITFEYHTLPLVKAEISF